MLLGRELSALLDVVVAAEKLAISEAASPFVPGFGFVPVLELPSHARFVLLSLPGAKAFQLLKLW